MGIPVASVVLALTISLLAWSAEPSSDNNHVFSPCSDASIQKSDGFTFGLRSTGDRVDRISQAYKILNKQVLEQGQDVSRILGDLRGTNDVRKVQQSEFELKLLNEEVEDIEKVRDIFTKKLEKVHGTLVKQLKKKKIPSVGLGTWQAIPGVVGQAVATAIKVGYRHIDCAQIYGNEKEIGSALKKLFEDGVVKREDLWITSKLWCSYQAPEDVAVALDRTLKDLQIDYIDLYLIHWPVRVKKGAVVSPENLVTADIPATWKALEALHDSGKTLAIGVSNFSVKKLGELLDVARVPPAVNQVECHPSWQQSKLREFCRSKGVHLSGYSPLGSPGSTYLKSEVLKHPVIAEVAQKLGKSPAQVALRWGLQMGHSVLPKSVNESRIKENFDIFDWSIPDNLFAKFSTIQQAKLIRGISFISEKGQYKSVEELWDGEI